NCGTSAELLHCAEEVRYDWMKRIPSRNRTTPSIKTNRFGPNIPSSNSRVRPTQYRNTRIGENKIRGALITQAARLFMRFFSGADVSVIESFAFLEARRLVNHLVANPTFSECRIRKGYPYGCGVNPQARSTI